MAELADVASPRGALEQLEILGYYQGAVGRQARTGGGTAALAWFQKEHEIAASGELDDDTARKLQDAHGE